VKQEAVERATFSPELVWTSLRAFLIGGDPSRGPMTKTRRVVSILSWLAAILMALGVWGDFEGKSLRPTAVVPIVSAAVVVPLVLMLSRPLLAWRIAWFTAVFAGILPDQGGRNEPWPWPPIEFVVLMFSVLAVALRHPRAVVVWTWLSALVLVFLFVDFNAIPGVIIGLTVLMVIGDQIRRRREVQSRLVVERERSELEAARRTVLEERTRIARELHDVVAHHMSLIAVRAESAPYRLKDMPEPVAEEFGAIANASREALTEMRRLLGVLRSETPPPVQPQPGVEDLTELVEAARGAGVDIRLDLPPGLRVPPSVGLTAYRIVQEALSNARRHASGAAVAITLAQHGPDLHVTVVNGPGAASSSNPTGGSQGLIGMYERATMLGGSLTTGATEDGGFRVHGTIPLQGAP
jgi:signal transduction histidine kinase